MLFAMLQTLVNVKSKLCDITYLIQAKLSKMNFQAISIYIHIYIYTHSHIYGYIKFWYTPHFTEVLNIP